MGKTLTEIDNKIAELKSTLKNNVGRDCEVYTRISGYHRATNNWNKGKMAEYKERKAYKFNC